jgi:hypothetical protein
MARESPRGGFELNPCPFREPAWGVAAAPAALEADRGSWLSVMPPLPLRLLGPAATAAPHAPRSVLTKSARRWMDGESNQVRDERQFRAA